MRMIMAMVLLSGCGNVEPVRCIEEQDAFMTEVYCHCVYSCTVTKTEIKVESDGFCSPTCISR
jgi:hypothetical protein